MIALCIVVAAVIWVTCAVLTFGLSFAYFQRHYPSIAEKEYYLDMRHCMLFAVFGLFGLIGFVAATGRRGLSYGFKWK